jgi:hypothetical protein
VPLSFGLADSASMPTLYPTELRIFNKMSLT